MNNINLFNCVKDLKFYKKSEKKLNFYEINQIIKLKIFEEESSFSINILISNILL